MAIPTKQLTPEKVHTLLNANPREQYEANLFLACALMRLGGGVTLTAQEFLDAAAAHLENRIEIVPQKTSSGAVVHMRVRV
jgi:hypothetical protein